ncbi:unnamed protein product [Merluccius merluccius]
MTIWCDFCKCHLSLPCSLHRCSADRSSSRGACKRSRSTKGASKVRRDHINTEIRSMRALLPVSQEEQQRLSYLHSMSAICTYIRKSVLLQGFPGGQGPGFSPPYETFLPALHGFILVVTTQGKLVYVSENVAEYLGHSMLDVLQGDTVYDMIERSDINTVKDHLESDNCSSTERSFVCCMHTSKAFKLKHGQCCSMLVRGSFQSASAASVATESVSKGERVFVALCTPTVDRWHGTEAAHLAPSFSSFHEPDLSFTRVSGSVFHYLGYTVEEMSSRSWYSLLHPEDLQRTADAHKSLVQTNEGFELEMVLRLQHKDLSWTWIYTRATNPCGNQSIHCTNYIISESEALYLIKKTNCSAFGPSLAEADFCLPQAAQMPQPQSYSLAKGFKRRRRCDSQCEEPTAKTRRVEGDQGEQDVYHVACVSSSGSPVTMGDSVLLFTPPHSPAPSNCSLQKESLACDFLMDLGGYTDLSPSSPETSPSYYPYLDSGPVTHPSPFRSLRAASPQAFGRGSVSVTGALLADHLVDLSPDYELAGCAAGAQLVPDCLSVPDALGSPGDCCPLDPEDFALLEQPQGGSTFQPHHVPRGTAASLHTSLLTPSPSPTSLDSFQYNDREHVEISILAQQISSLANSFDLYSTPGPVQSVARLAAEAPPPPCDWPKSSSLSTAAAAAALPFKPELVLDDSVIDSILKELDAVEASGPCAGTRPVSHGSQRGHPCEMTLPHQGNHRIVPPTVVDPRPMEQFTVASTSMDPFALRLGSHEQNPGLHQLNRYIHRGPQQDGLLEEALY